MKTHNKNENGFGVIEGLLIFVVIAIIGGTGWYMWSQRKDDATKVIDSFVTCVSAGNPVQESFPEQCSANGKTFTKNQPNDATNTKESSFTIGSHKLYYVLPDKWTTKEDPVLDHGNAVISGTITFTSPDYVETTDGGECTFGKSGKIIYLYAVEAKDSNDTFINNILHPTGDTAQYNFVRNGVTTTMGKQKAVQYESTPGECGYRLVTATLFEGYEVHISVWPDISDGKKVSINEPYNTAYNSLVSSVRFE